MVNTLTAAAATVSAAAATCTQGAHVRAGTHGDNNNIMSIVAACLSPTVLLARQNMEQLTNSAEYVI